MRRKLPPAPGVDLSVHLEKLREEPISGPDWPILSLRALAMGLLLLLAIFWKMEWKGWADLIPLIAAAIGGYLLHGNVLRIRDPRFWKPKPGKREVNGTSPSTPHPEHDTSQPAITTRLASREAPPSQPDDSAERP